MARGEVLAEMVLQGEGSFISGIDEAGDEMEETSGSAGILAGALGRMGDQISDAIVPTSLLGSRLDEAGDEASEAGMKAAGASAGFMSLTASTSGASFTMGVFSAITSKTILALGGLAIAAGAVVTALAPIAIGAAAIAAAFGLVLGTGFLAWSQKSGNSLESIKEELMLLVTEFGGQFMPLIDKAVEALPDFVYEILRATGELQPFINALEDLGAAAFRIIPQLVGWFFDLGRWALPLMRDLAGWIIDSVVPALIRFVDIGKDMTSQFGRLRTSVDSFWQGLQPFLAALGPLISELLRLGGILLTIALRLGGRLLPLLAPLVDWIRKGVKRVNDFVTSLGGVTSSTNDLSPQLQSLRDEILILWDNLQPLISTLMDIGRRVIPFLVGGIEMMMKTFTDLGLIALNVINGDFGEARDIFMRILKRIRNFAEKWGGRLISWLRNTLVPKAVDWFGTMGERAEETIKDALGNLISWLKNDAWSDIKSAALSLGDILASAFQDAFNAAMPDSVSIPSVTIDNPIPGESGWTIGGGSLDLPSLASGGRIMSDGLFVGHAGEQVMTAAEVDKAEDSPVGGGIEQVVVQLDADAVTELLRGEAVDVFDSKIERTERKKRRRGTF